MGGDHAAPVLKTESVAIVQWEEPPSSTGRQAGDPARLAALLNRKRRGSGADKFWESLQLGFIELRTACAINPPGAAAGRLTAIRDAEATLGNWQLNYHDGIDGSGIAKRFTWHAQSAAARLGFVGEEAEALAFWLDRLLRDAPTQYLIKTRISASNPSIAVVETIEILDVCGLSAEYCRKCEADEAGSQPVPKLVAKSRMPTESAPISPHGTSDTLADSALIFELLHFQYRYPRGFSSSDQRAVEAVRLEANRRLTETSISSYDDFGAATYRWVLELASGAARVFGRVSEKQKWAANQTRDAFRDYVTRATAAARLTRPRVAKLFHSQEWKGLDAALFPSRNSNPAGAITDKKPPEVVVRPDQADRFSKQEQGGGVRHVSTPATTDRRSDPQLIPGDKGNLELLRGTDGELKRAVTLEFARRFGGVTLRAIQDAAENGKLKTEGTRQQRRVLVESLLQYFPPEK